MESTRHLIEILREFKNRITERRSTKDVQKEHDQMKRISVISATILFLLFGATAIANAQHDQQGNDQNKSKQAQQHQQAQPAQQHQQAADRNSKCINSSPPDQRKVRQNRNRPMAAPITAACKPTVLRTVESTPVAFRNTKGRCAVDLLSLAPLRGKTSIKAGPSAEAITATGFPTTASGNTSAGITSSASTVFPLVFVGGMPRFQYDGYWVTLMDPWPETWGPNWYETDDVYLDYTGDGYYLYDRLYPGFPIAVTVTF